METYSTLHWIVVGLAFVALFTWIIPMALILRRIGYSPWWGLLAAVPAVAMFLLWIVALAPWPAASRRPTDDALAEVRT